METGCDREGRKDSWIRQVEPRILKEAMVDTRATLRYPIDLPAQLAVGGAQLSARIRNLSLGGVYLIGPMLPIGTRCRLTFRVPNGDAFDHWCITRWTAADGCGLQFDASQPIDTHQLAGVIRGASRVTNRAFHRLPG